MMKMIKNKIKKRIKMIIIIIRKKNKKILMTKKILRMLIEVDYN